MNALVKPSKTWNNCIHCLLYKYAAAFLLDDGRNAMASHFFRGGQALGAMFNQLVHSCAHRLFLEQLFVTSERARNPVIEIHTIKWKEGGLLGGARTFLRSRRVINRSLRIRERLLQTRALISIVDQRKSTFELPLKLNAEEKEWRFLFRPLPSALQTGSSFTTRPPLTGLGTSLG